MLPYWALGNFDGNELYRVGSDPEEEHDLTGTPQEKVAADLLHDALRSVEAPSEQFERLGL